MSFWQASPAKQEAARAAYAEKRRQDRERTTRALSVPVKGLHKGTMRASTQAMQPRPKIKPVRDEAYRRLVAALPCINCGVEGYSQAAHPNYGKGGSTKTSDTDCFPLCADRPGVRGCHSAFDAGAMLSKTTRREIEKQWSELTRKFLVANGLFHE